MQLLKKLTTYKLHKYITVSRSREEIVLYYGYYNLRKILINLEKSRGK